MKSVLISVRPKWCEKIANGEKKIEVRKNRPNIPTPFKCYIYCTVGGDALCPFHANSSKWDIHRQNNGTTNGRKMTARERAESDYCFANGKVIGEFVCYYTERMRYPDGGLVDVVDAQMSCLTAKEIITYSSGKPLYGWPISGLKIYDKPRGLSEFGLTRAPQSWCYVEEQEAQP